MADREDRRLRRRPSLDREQDVRMRDLGYLMGVVGIGALSFVMGRASAPGSACCDDLLQSNVSLLLCAAEISHEAAPPTGAG